MSNFRFRDTNQNHFNISDKGLIFSLYLVTISQRFLAIGYLKLIS